MLERHEVLGLSYDEFSRLARRILPPGAGGAGAVYKAAFAEGRIETAGLGLSARSEKAWLDSFEVKLLEAGRVVEEEGDFGKTVKAVLRLADGHEIECVHIPMPPRPDGRPRSSICVSSQVGCRMGCAFCETGAGGFVRDLKAAEIVSELVTARVLLGWDIGNVVFMGMGEPLDNLDNVAKSLTIITDSRGLGLSWERITVCTSGNAEGIAALRELGHPRLNLSLSLNAADDATRTRLMPANRASPLDALASVLAAYPRRRNFVLGLNWCLIPGVNDSREDARRIGEFSRRVGRSMVNLIGYNPGSKPLAGPPTEEELDRFALWLGEEGVLVKRRAAKGRGIMAACGQLGGKL
jgi:23S rRNA (adenine2503-C2)-methyltransferase